MEGSGKNELKNTDGIPHSLTLEQRQRLTVTAVSEVLRLDSETAVLRTEDSLLLVSGYGLELKQLSPDSGKVEIRGKIAQLSYEQAPSGGFFRRLFG